MDFNTSHDIVHKFAGGTAECEYCQNKMTKDAVKKRAAEIIQEQNERRNKMSQGYYSFSEGDKIVAAVDLEEVIIAGEQTETQEVKVLPIGKWNTTKYGSVEIKNEDIDKMVKNFSIRKGIPIDTDHDGGAANGWVKKLVAKANDGLYAVIEWTTSGKKYLNEKIYKYFSPEFSFNYVDPQTSKKYGPVFLAGTLTNRPLFKNLPALTANETGSNQYLTDNNISVVLLSQEETNMDLAKLRTKTKGELSADEFNFVKENANSLTADERVKFEIATDEDKKTLAANDGKKKCAECSDMVKEDDMADHMKTHKAKKASEDDNQVISASELKQLREDAAAGKKASEDLRVMKATEEVEDKYLLSENGKGKIAKKAKNELVELYLSFDDKQKELFDKVMGAVTTLDFSEQGEGGENDSLTAVSTFEKLVDDEMKADDKLPYDKAIIKAKEKNPEAYKAYNEAVERGEVK